jgi:hypothetical protein
LKNPHDFLRCTHFQNQNSTLRAGVYLQEDGDREQSHYLKGFLYYIVTSVLQGRVNENMSRLLKESELEWADAVLADIRQNGEP